MSANTPDLATYHRMRDQSMKVPWREFSTACERLTTWRCFATWAAAIAAAEKSMPDWLVREIEKQCPGFLAARQHPASLTALEADLDKWVDYHMFPEAYEGGWRQALIYYVDKSPEVESMRSVPGWPRPLTHYPALDDWRRQAFAGDPPRLSAAVTEYVEWEAFAFWMRLVVDLTGTVSGTLETVLDTRCPGFLASLKDKASTRPSYSMWCWEQLVYWIEEHNFSDAVQGSWLETLRNTARRHVRDERMVAYWAHCDRRWHRKRPAAWPSFEEWLAAADAYVEAAED